MKIVCVSDMHGKYSSLSLPEGDVLLIAGDTLYFGEKYELDYLNNWFINLPYKKIIMIAGNHDWVFQRDRSARKLITNAIYLQDQEVNVNGLRIYGSPWQPTFYDWAFNANRGDDIKQHWDKIPENIDILITHGPPYGILDKNLEGEHVGCSDLLTTLHRVKPKYHIFGHIHEGYGKQQLIINDTIINCLNVSVCNRKYEAIQAPQIITVNL